MVHLVYRVPYHKDSTKSKFNSGEKLTKSEISPICSEESYQEQTLKSRSKLREKGVTFWDSRCISFVQSIKRSRIFGPVGRDLYWSLPKYPTQ